MTILQIIGWIIVFSAGVGFIWSIFFYLFGYLKIEKKLKTNKGDGMHEQLDGKINWRIIIFFQTLALTLIVVLLYFLL